MSCTFVDAYCTPVCRAMDEDRVCPFCEETFETEFEFWKHVNAPSCQSDPAEPNGLTNLPSNSSDTEFKHLDSETLSVNFSSLDNGPKKAISSNFSSLDLKEIKISLPSPQAQSPIDPIHNRTQNENLFSKLMFPGPTTELTAVHTKEPKWKCTLCNLEFLDQRTMTNHVRSSEHEAKILVGTEISADKKLASSRTSPDLPSSINDVTNAAIPKDELVGIIRQVVQEELLSMFQLYSNSKKVSKSSSPTSSSLPKAKYSDSKFIKMHGGSIYCEACCCSVTSAANLSAHFEGKKHRANVAKLGG